MTIPIYLDTIEMNTGKRDGNGALWIVSETGGWFDAPDLRQSIIDKAISHGSLMAMSVMDKRRVQLSGYCQVVGTEDNIWRSRDNLVAALTTVTASKTIAVNEYGTLKTMLYWGAGGTTITIQPGGFQFNVTLVMEDPRKYASFYSKANTASYAANNIVRTTGNFLATGLYTFTNIASSAATAQLTIQGYANGVASGTIGVNSYTTAAGESVLQIDTSSRTVYGYNAAMGNQVNRYSALNTSTLNWFDFAPGVNNQVALAGNTSWAGNIAWRDTWI